MQILKSLTLLPVLFILTSISALADVKPSTMFGNHMVLQQAMRVPIWGKADPGEKITVEFAGQKKSSTANTDGRWMVKLDPLKANSKGSDLIISGENNITYSDVLVGEVWICSGQSNMEMSVNAVENLKPLLQGASEKPIRTYNVPTSISFTPEESCRGTWTDHPPQSAVAFGFSYYLQKRLQVPVAIILTCWGSSSIEGWMPAEMTNQLPHFKVMMDKFLSNKEQLEMCKSIIDVYKKTGKIDRFSNDPDENKKMAAKKRSANVYARTRINMLYNAMLHPIIPYAVRGMVWYQGEANSKTVQDELQYAESLRLWVENLRSLWNQEKFYFLDIMLPGYCKITGGTNRDTEYPDNHSWAWLRESQLKIERLPDTAVVNAIDLGELKNIHPKDKKVLCERLAMLAANKVYHKNIIAEGPRFAGFEINGNKFIVKFSNADGLKTVDGAPPKAFWLADKKGSWHKGTAEIKNNKVVLHSNEVKIPVACRYAFAAKPDVNLVNAAGLPAYPFRTDEWNPDID